MQMKNPFAGLCLMFKMSKVLKKSQANSNSLIFDSPLKRVE